MTTMLQALMTEIKVQAVKTDQQAVTILDQHAVKMDEQAAQIRELVAGFTQVKTEAHQFTLERQLCGVSGHCMTLPGAVMSTITVGGVEKRSVFVADMEKLCWGWTPCFGMQHVMTSEGCRGRCAEKSYH